MIIVQIYLADNGFNPIWNEICEFDIANPAFALLRFVVLDEDVFGDPNCIGQATYPVSTDILGYLLILFEILKFLSNCK